MINRLKDTDFVQLLSYFPVVGIVGSRQVGKTTLSGKLSSLINKECIYLDLESPEDLQKLSYPEDYLNQRIDKCIIIDEIQIKAELFTILRPIIDKNREAARFVILGSASPTIIRNASEALTGRIAYIELGGLNLKEVGDEKMNKLWFRGGYPNSFLSPNNELSKIWLDNYIENYIKRELPQLGLNTSTEKIRKFWRMIAHSHGKLWNTASFARALKVDNKTIDHYRDFLEGAFLINVLEPFHYNIKKRMVKSPKVYIKDSGILHRLNRISNQEDLSATTLIGDSWEGFVQEQIKQLKNAEIDLYFFRTQHGAEIDIVFAKSMKAIATAEIKLTNAPKTNKGLMESIKTLETNKNYIITPNSEDYLIKENVRVCSLMTFINEYLPEIV